MYEEDGLDLDEAGATGAMVLPALPPGVKFTITSTMIQLLNLKEVFYEEEMGASIEERLAVETLIVLLMNFEADFRSNYVETVNALQVFIAFTDCAAEDRSAILVEITDELGDPPFNQLIAFSILPSASLYYGSLGGTVLLRGTNRRLADCFFPRLLIHFLQGFVYWNKWWCMSIWRLAMLDSAIHRLSFLVLFSPFCSVLHLSVHASTKTSNT
uniref:Uncharacterized protein n=1 Tax=Solanum tuberosum TaxID=4113 RepID=M1DJH7_SOLTU